jgi:hypothetical protein
MMIPQFTPYSQKSAIGKCSSLVVEALVARDRTITFVSSDTGQLIDRRSLLAGIEFLTGLSFTIREQRVDDICTRTVGLAERAAKLEAPSDDNSVDRDSGKAQHEA